MRYLSPATSDISMCAGKDIFTKFWLVIWAIGLSLGWLLPNHYLPWPSFHMEAWVSLLLAGAALAVVVRAPGKSTLSSAALVALIMVAMPFVQYAAGMQAFAGTAWVATAYLLGFFLAIAIGIRWESGAPGQMADGLFLAIGIAAIFSVGLQLHQWLELDRLFIWDMGATTGRPFANFGQPNLLATFLIWGLLAAGWAVQRNYVSGVTGVIIALYLLFGVALTASRTAWIAMAILIGATWMWRGMWRNRWAPWTIVALGGYFIGCLHAKDWLQEYLLLGGQTDLVRMATEVRPQAWALFIDAVQHKPWIGYGWGQIAMAHLQVAVNNPPLYILFSNSHNFFLDLVLWNGIPIGLLLIGIMIFWLWRHFRGAKKIEDILLLLLLVVVGNHALLEYPLSYAYFLFPAGLVVGALDMRLGAQLWHVGGRWMLFSVCALSTCLLVLIARDYFRVEASYLALRFEFANIRTNEPKEPPKVLVLNHLSDMIRFARFEPHKDMSPEELNWMLNVANLYPSAGVIHKLAAAMAWNDRPNEARLWLQRMCLMVNAAQCEAVRQAWANQALNDPLIREISWPEIKKNNN